MDLSTPSATKIVGSLALIVVAGLGWTVVVGPETGALSSSREEVVSVRDQNSLLAVQLAGLERQRQDLAQTRKTARRLAVKFPPTADQPGLFEEITTAAQDAGIGADGVTNLAPTPPTTALPPGAPAPAPAPAPGSTPVPAIGLATQTVVVAVTGTYDQTQRLLENFENMPRAYLVTGVTLAGDAATGAYATTITGDMFVLAPVPEPGKIVNLASTTPSAGGS